MTICLNSPSVTFPGPCPRHGPGNVTFFISKLLSEVLTAACNFGQEIFCSLLWSYPLCMARSDTWRNKKKVPRPQSQKNWLWDLGTSSMTALKLLVRIKHQYFGKTLFWGSFGQARPGRMDEGFAITLKTTSDLPLVHMIHFEFFLASVRAKFLEIYHIQGF